MFIPQLREGPLSSIGPWKKFLQHKNHFDLLLKEEINFKKEKLKMNLNKKDGETSHDILSLLIQHNLSDGDLLDELRTLLVAGHETTAITLTWALYYSFSNVHIKNQLESLNENKNQNGHEVESFIHEKPLQQETLIDAIIAESMRIHPVLPIILRKLKSDFEFCGQMIPAGNSVAGILTLLHHNPEVFPSPQEFKPERFLHHKFSPFDYAPFGGGSRRCIGAIFASFEMKIILVSLLRHFKLNLLPHQKKPRGVIHNITMAPRHKIYFSIH
jgi:cytochrome P450